MHYERKEHDEHTVLAIDIDIYDIKDVKYQDSSSKLWPSARSSLDHYKIHDHLWCPMGASSGENITLLCFKYPSLLSTHLYSPLGSTGRPGLGETVLNFAGGKIKTETSRSQLIS